METLKGLNLLNVGKQPLSTDAYNFYINTFAGGTGVNGTYLITDFIGTAIGVTAGTFFDQATTIITNRASTLSTLSDIYQRMVRSCNGTYGPVPSGPITVPAGPGAGSYLNPDSAVTSLINRANIEIGNLVTTLGTDTAALNTAWNNICIRVNYEVNNLSLCNIDLNNLISGDRFSALNLVVSLPELGNDTTAGGSGQFMESIARTNNLAGQAMIGAMREGRNNTKMNVVRINRDNTVPDNSTSVPAQATLSSSSYTVAEARAFVNQINRAL